MALYFALGSFVGLVVIAVINALLIQFAVGIMGRKASMGGAFLAWLCSMAINVLVPGNTVMGFVIGLLLWLAVLRALFELSWPKAVVAALLIAIVNFLFMVTLGLAGLAFFSILH